MSTFECSSLDDNDGFIIFSGCPVLYAGQFTTKNGGLVVQNSVR